MASNIIVIESDLYVSLLFDERSAALRVTWRGGVSIEHDDVRVIIDPQNNRLDASAVFVTHAHFDHSEAFRRNYDSKYSSQETMELVSAYGLQVENWQLITIDRKVNMDDVKIIPHNSGHVLGSYEFEVDTPEGNILFSGDFNNETTKTMKPAEPVACDVLVLETTFGAPNFIFPSEALIAKEMIDWAEKILERGKIPVFQTDPLGNAQEVISIFNEFTSLPVVTHWRVSKANQIYKAHGYKLEYIDAKTEEADDLISSGNLVLITPKQLSLPDSPDFVPALVSGWALWSRHKAFPLSDHADFPHIMRFVEDCNPKIVLTCHGGRFNETMANFIEKKLGLRAYPIQLIPTSIYSKQ